MESPILLLVFTIETHYVWELSTIIVMMNEIVVDDLSRNIPKQNMFLCLQILV